MFQGRRIERSDDALRQDRLQFFEHTIDHRVDANPDEAGALQFDERRDLRVLLKQIHDLAQEWDACVAEAAAESNLFVYFHLHDLLDGQVVNLVVQTSGTPQVCVVQQHRHAVGRHLYVELDVTGPCIDGGAQSGQRVFRVAKRITAVSDKLGWLDGDVLWNVDPPHSG
jgi:hypothetical protein